MVDPRAFYHLRKTGYPLVFDITHSIRKYGIPSADPRGGNREVMPTIARAGVAAGVDGVFIETHPDPAHRQVRCGKPVVRLRPRGIHETPARPPRRGSETQKLNHTVERCGPVAPLRRCGKIRHMELYLDSADIKEIDEAFKLGFLTGLTTTPTFMHRGGVTNIDKMILDLAKKVPILQVEALGETAEEVVKEAKRQLKMGLKKETTVFKIPVALEGLRACRMLRNEGIMVNVHLVYTLQQAYMAMQAGATYVCPLVGRLQDQGHDALSLVQQCVEAVNYYGYDSKIMFSSVRTVEHVRNAVDHRRTHHHRALEADEAAHRQPHDAAGHPAVL